MLDGEAPSSRFVYSRDIPDNVVCSYITEGFVMNAIMSTGSVVTRGRVTEGIVVCS
jgi:hypothetical protein